MGAYNGKERIRYKKKKKNCIITKDAPHVLYTDMILLGARPCSVPDAFTSTTSHDNKGYHPWTKQTHSQSSSSLENVSE